MKLSLQEYVSVVKAQMIFTGKMTLDEANKTVTIGWIETKLKEKSQKNKPQKNKK